ncbi:MAG: metalloregulator ArsR/SmtB family transcription factor [Candidatus Omnitrophota bacterium]
MKNLEKVLKALADKNRIRILKLLQIRKMCVCELAFVLGITQPSVSRHLKKLKAACLIKDEQEGLWTNYFLNKTNNPCCCVLIKKIYEWLKTDPIVKKDLGKAKKIDRTKLCCR